MNWFNNTPTSATPQPNQPDPQLGLLTAGIRDLNEQMRQLRESMVKEGPPVKFQLITLTTEYIPFSTFNYPFFGIIVSQNQTLTVNAQGQIYTVPLSAGYNPIHIFDGYTIAGTGFTCTLVWSNEQYGSDVFAGGTLMSGTDGTNTHTVKTDTSGNLQTVLTGSNVPNSQAVPLKVIDNSGGTVYAASSPITTDGAITSATVLSVGAFTQAYNNAQWDRVRNNTQGTLLASAARTSTVQSSQQTNYNAKGVQITLNITAASGTGGLTLIIHGYDPVSGTFYNILVASSAIISSGVYVYELYPGVGAAGQQITNRVSGALPRLWNVGIGHGDASSYTYSVGYALIL